MVAHRGHVGAVFPRAPLGQRCLLRVRLSCYMEGWAPVWQAGSGRSPGHQCSSRPLSGLLVYGEVSGVGFLRTRNCTYAGDLRGLCPPWELGTRHDAACGWTCHGRSAGASTLGTRLIVGADVIALASCPGLAFETWKTAKADQRRVPGALSPTPIHQQSVHEYCPSTARNQENLIGSMSASAA